MCDTMADIINDSGAEALDTENMINMKVAVVGVLG